MNQKCNVLFVFCTSRAKLDSYDLELQLKCVCATSLVYSAMNNSACLHEQQYVIKFCICDYPGRKQPHVPKWWFLLSSGILFFKPLKLSRNHLKVLELKIEVTCKVHETRKTCKKKGRALDNAKIDYTHFAIQLFSRTIKLYRLSHRKIFVSYIITTSTVRRFET